MDDRLQSITWEGYPHYHAERGSDWFWILGIITIAVTVATVVLGDILFGIVIFIAGIVAGLQAMHEPKMIPFSITSRGITIDEKTYPYATLESFYIDDEHRHGPHLLIKSQKLFMPLIIVPLPEDAVDDVEEMIANRLPEEHLEEPLVNVILEFLGLS